MTSIHVVTRKASFWKGAYETRQNCFTINIHSANICQNETRNEDERKVHLSSKSTNHVVSFNLNSDRNIIHDYLNPTSNQTFRATWTNVFLCGLRLFRAELSFFFFFRKMQYIFFNIMQNRKTLPVKCNCTVWAHIRCFLPHASRWWRSGEVQKIETTRGLQKIKRNSLLPCIKLTVNFCVVFYRLLLRESFSTCWEAVIPTAFVLGHDNSKRYRILQLESSFEKVQSPCGSFFITRFKSLGNVWH